MNRREALRGFRMAAMAGVGAVVFREEYAKRGRPPIRAKAGEVGSFGIGPVTCDGVRITYVTEFDEIAGFVRHAARRLPDGSVHLFPKGGMEACKANEIVMTETRGFVHALHNAYDHEGRVLRFLHVVAGPANV